jgi:hypothetical protein
VIPESETIEGNPVGYLDRVSHLFSQGILRSFVIETEGLARLDDRKPPV